MQRRRRGRHESSSGDDPHPRLPTLARGAAMRARTAIVDAPHVAMPRGPPRRRDVQPAVPADPGADHEGPRAGEWKPGEMIPSEVELAERYGVSQGTVRKAIDGWPPTTCSCAARARARSSRRITRRARSSASSGSRPTTRDESRRAACSSCRRMRAPAEIARRLRPEGRRRRRRDPARAVVRRRADGARRNLAATARSSAGLTAERIAAYRGPLYGLFESEFATPMTRAEEKIRAVAADAERRRLLGVAPGAPLLSVERVSMTYGDRPVEVRRGLYVDDAASLSQRARLTTTARVPMRPTGRRARFGVARRNRRQWRVAPARAIDYVCDNVRLSRDRPCHGDHVSITRDSMSDLTRPADETDPYRNIHIGQIVALPLAGRRHRSRSCIGSAARCCSCCCRSCCICSTRA